MIKFMLKILYLSLAVLNLYRRCINLVSQFNWPCYIFFKVKVKNLAFDTSKVITNAWFSMKNYGLYIVRKIRFNSMNHVGHVLNDYFNRTNPQWRRRCKIIITQKNTCLTSGSTNIKKFFSR